VKANYENKMEELWALAGEIGALGEDDFRYALVYKKLSEALDLAEAAELIIYTEEDGGAK
jgi:hypothetical protein